MKDLNKEKIKSLGQDTTISADRRIIYVHKGLNRFLVHNDQRVEISLKVQAENDQEDSILVRELYPHPANFIGTMFVLVDKDGITFQAKLTKAKQSPMAMTAVFLYFAILERISDFEV